MDSTNGRLGQPSLVLLELRVVPLSVPLAIIHRALEHYATGLRCVRTWAVISHIAKDREGEATLWVLCFRKEPLRRLDNSFLSWKRALERIIAGCTVQRRQWSGVQGSSRGAQVYADVHALEDDSVEAATARLHGIARNTAQPGGLLLSSPLHPLPPSSVQVHVPASRNSHEA